MDGRHASYVWFDDVEIVSSRAGFFPECIVDGKRVPLPIAILHPDCTLRGVGDKGCLGVPVWWAAEHGLAEITPGWKR